MLFLLFVHRFEHHHGGLASRQLSRSESYSQVLHLQALPGPSGLCSGSKPLLSSCRASLAQADVDSCSAPVVPERRTHRCICMHARGQHRNVIGAMDLVR
jgi:hypothetical protein